MSNDPIQMAIDALTSAKYFISNGIELGFIRMPDPDVPDSAHQTPKIVDSALTALRQHQQDGGWRSIESAPNEICNLRWFYVAKYYKLGGWHYYRVRYWQDGRGRIGFIGYDQEGIVFVDNPDFWRPEFTPPAPKKENDDVPS